jgi:integrase
MGMDGDMAIHRLGPTALNRKTPGTYGDGNGLWLQITVAKDGKGRNRSWVFRYSTRDPTRRSGYRTREMGLGSADKVSLVEARDLALQCCKQRLQGIDPIEARDARRAAQATAAAKVTTFDQCVGAYIAAHRAAWRSQKHAVQWTTTLRKHASPVFGSLPVQAVDTTLVVKALERIWHQTPETASRLRGRIEAVLDWATVRGFRQGDNPARWTGYLDKLLPAPRKLKPMQHHEAMAYRDVPSLMAKLRAMGGTNARALEFTILSASRTGEVLGARWDEIDSTAKTWTVPGSRMKAGKEHRVPLSGRCIAILTDMQEVQRNGYVFPGARNDALTSHPMAQLLKRMGHSVTVHGFRSAFRDWCREQTSFPREVAEQALAHHIGNSVERAYARGDVLETRRKLMDAWARYCATPAPTGAAVLPLRKAHADA